MPRQRGDLIDRREALRLGGTAVLVLGSTALGGHPRAGAQAAALVTRAVPSSGERLPVVGVKIPAIAAVATRARAARPYVTSSGTESEIFT